ncbi:hypothetical protein Xets_03913 [Xenorhabdus sp. TS4]|nr:hypothetical protein [Xenorhabdus sp. TS4]
MERTNLGKTHTPRTTLKSGEWGKPIGYSVLVDSYSAKFPASLGTHGYWHVIGARDTNAGYAGFLASYANGLIYYGHALAARENPTWYALYTTSNTTVVDGYLKTASPIIQIYPDGKFETNDESEGAIVERLSEGVYLIKNVLGFNADAAWGGVDGGVEIPLCKNKLPLIWVDYKVLPDGAIKLMTYHREHTGAPTFARNTREGYVDGDPIDTPAGRSISVRVQMPESSIWNQQQRKLTESE